MASVKGKFSTDMEVGHINGDHIQGVCPFNECILGR